MNAWYFDDDLPFHELFNIQHLFLNLCFRMRCSFLRQRHAQNEKQDKPLVNASQIADQASDVAVSTILHAEMTAKQGHDDIATKCSLVKVRQMGINNHCFFLAHELASLNEC